ncbi:DUF3168 domain-containing protein [Qipengyuania sp. JC766]|uniref:tail completion protein gp17 n=1 Tax=Qipengyuania sp. JC766 TaxID=3232139 RepID=UPI00345ADEC8
MEQLLRTAMLDWLRAGPAPLDRLNGVTEESPDAASAPCLAIAASASADWSTKTQAGREVRLALELVTRADPLEDAVLHAAIDARVSALPRRQTGVAIASITFLRARTRQGERGLRTTLLEYRIRALADGPRPNLTDSGDFR